jgi:hypothetical protein
MKRFISKIMAVAVTISMMCLPLQAWEPASSALAGTGATYSTNAYSSNGIEISQTSYLANGNVGSITTNNAMGMPISQTQFDVTANGQPGGDDTLISNYYYSGGQLTRIQSFNTGTGDVDDTFILPNGGTITLSHNVGSNDPTPFLNDTNGNISLSTLEDDYNTTLQTGQIPSGSGVTGITVPNELLTGSGSSGITSLLNGFNSGGGSNSGRSLLSLALQDNGGVTLSFGSDGSLQTVSVDVGGGASASAGSNAGGGATGGGTPTTGPTTGPNGTTTTTGGSPMSPTQDNNVSNPSIGGNDVYDLNSSGAPGETIYRVNSKSHYIQSSSNDGTNWNNVTTLGSNGTIVELNVGGGSNGTTFYGVVGKGGKTITSFYNQNGDTCDSNGNPILTGGTYETLSTNYWGSPQLSSNQIKSGTGWAGGTSLNTSGTHGAKWVESSNGTYSLEDITGTPISIGSTVLLTAPNGTTEIATQQSDGTYKFTLYNGGGACDPFGTPLTTAKADGIGIADRQSYAAAGGTHTGRYWC